MAGRLGLPLIDELKMKLLKSWGAGELGSREAVRYKAST